MYVFYVLKAKPLQMETFKKVSVGKLHMYLFMDTYICVCVLFSQ